MQQYFSLREEKSSNCRHSLRLRAHYSLYHNPKSIRTQRYQRHANNGTCLRYPTPGAFTAEGINEGMGPRVDSAPSQAD